MSKLSPEFRLAAACCRWPPTPERDAEVRARAAHVDWVRFLAVVRRQRVEGLASAALRAAEVEVPITAAGELSRAAADIARQNLAFAAESARLKLLFKRAGIEILFVKGATLDMLAYGSLAVKRARDIDLLVAPECVEQACALLGDAGYVRTAPKPEIGPDRFAIWVKLCKETTWRNQRSGIIVEVHSQLVDNPVLLPGVDVRSPSQTVALSAGLSLPTLQTQELFAYLCVHGATHAWSRLKWLADLAALLGRFDDAEVEGLYCRSLELGVGRCSAQALLLCHELFGTPLSPALLAELKADTGARWLVALAFEAMAGRNREVELHDTVLGTVPIHLSHFALGRGWRYKSGELARKLSNHEDQAHISLPRPLHLLYPLLSVPSWLYRRFRGTQRPAV